VWASSPTQKRGDAFVATMKRPEKGYAAMFAEIEYPGPHDPYTVSTLIRILGAK
jgi:hypothetical protein